MEHPIRSEYLSASAGSGKTFALSCRYCHLVMSNVPPEEICALTFTRAATREIFTAVVERLTDKDNVLQTVEGGLSREAALAKILDALPRLQISTIDAFASKVAKLFAYELGLNPDFTLYDDGESTEARLLLHESVRRALADVGERPLHEVVSLFDIQHEESTSIKALSAQLRDFISASECVLEKQPLGWGDLETLGATHLKFCEARASVVEEARARLETDLSRCDNKSGIPKRTLTKLHSILSNYHAEVTSLRQLKMLWGDGDKGNKLLADMREYVKLGVCIYYNIAVHLGRELPQYFAMLSEDLIARDVQQTAKHTRQLYRALTVLTETHRQLANELGLISFTALTKALARVVGGRLTMRDVAGFYVAYRLDCEFRHLMIDEFQDTSIEQWSILSGMAHELAESDDGTFFYVGDVKQSIYGWRGGDATLFGDPTRLPPIPEGAPLVVSYRSCPTVLNLVNRVMQLKLPVVKEGEEPEAWQRAAVEEWNSRWQEHIPAEQRRSESGYVKVVGVPGNKDEWRKTIAEQIAERWKMLADKEVTIAVLGATNNLFTDIETGLLTHLQRLGVPCALEGKRSISETPLGTLVLQLLHWMSDPRATLWRTIIEKLGVVQQLDEQVTLSTWITCVNRQGFSVWLDALMGPRTAFSKTLSAADRSVLDMIRKGLSEIDAQGIVDPREAKRILTDLKVSSIAAKGVVNLMTIHQAKGLTFSVVFTILAGNIISTKGPMYEVGADWVLEKPLLGEVYKVVPELQAAADTRKHAGMRDALCALYVAITRAKREQILFAPEKEVASAAKRSYWIYQSFFGEMPTTEDSEDEDALKTYYEEGDVDWWQTLEARANIAEEAEETPLEWVKATASEKIEVQLPSEQGKAKTVSEILAKTSGRARDFGVSLHDCLAQIEWSESPIAGVPREIFRKPQDEPCEVWRERPFSVQCLTDGAPSYLAGQFDRVHIFPKSRRAVIYDFKSGYSAHLTPAYERQLRGYRTALSALLGYDEEKIQMKLVFTRYEKIVEVAG